ncbi:metal ABC transporter solute-binding protein, Zn/Mn family [Streptomyces sp. NPDC006879]|uniref:metal ABC transporter solute-binding protein, Zn/Mn family n=1 Tax=Streptomyces sp. NPDC006879 TaxID=3364767 RepID=UPI0036C54CA3
MARIRAGIIRIPALVALTGSLALGGFATGCTKGDASADGHEGNHENVQAGAQDPKGTGQTGGRSDKSKPVVVATTTWEGAFAKAAGAEDVQVIVPQSVHHAPDYDPKPSDLAAVAKADFVLYAPFEPYAAKIKEAAGSKAKLVEVNLDNGAAKVEAEVGRLGALFGTQEAASKWQESFKGEYATLSQEVKSAWPGGKRPQVVAQLFTVWSAELGGFNTVGTYGPEAVTPSQLAELSTKKPSLVLDNAHMSTGTVLPGSKARQIAIVNYPDNDLDLMPVFRNAAAELKKALGG